MNKLVLFGAGKIGRSFIGQLFSRGGYEVIFVDIDSALIDELNARKSYRVMIKSDLHNEVLKIRNVRGIHLDDRQAVTDEISGSSLLACCIGPANLHDIVPLIAEGIRAKSLRDPEAKTDLIIAENLRHASEYMRTLFIGEFGDAGFVDRNIGLIETSIGKMVPIMTKKEMEEDRLCVFAEPYNTLILDRKGFRNPVPDIKDLAAKNNMKAWVDRKSFIHNLGHASAAYYGYLRHPQRKYLFEVLNDPEVLSFTMAAMQQSSAALRAEYPGEFSDAELSDHIDDLISRFRNRSLGDTVFRIGMDLHRKLGPEDRLTGAIRMAARHQLPYDRISDALACGFYFRATDEAGNMHPGDKAFADAFSKSEIAHIIQTYCGIDPVHEPEPFDAILHSCRLLSSNLTFNH